MAETWYGGDAPHSAPLGLTGWLRVIARAIPLGLLVFGGLLVLLAIRLIERPLCGVRRPVTPHITQVVCRLAFILLGIRYSVIGTPMAGPGAAVANHSSWLDIFALNARKRVYFVSKSEVAGWPGVGWLARATGTVFIRRDRREAASQISIFRERLAAGHKLLFFPEGTSTDGQQVLPFKPTLFAAFFDDALRDTLQIQPVTVNYTAPSGADPRFYGWWGDMDFGPHLLSTLGAPRQGTVTVTYHAPVKVSDFEDRKALAKATEEAVRDGLERVNK
ncbi:lysophospholipid acyltransferase family protein [Cognatiyoonia sp. IB215446]|uniref:lysophospholipid acyltransferase family protein n=1 Tax=Cognatiyoonia sp. IB215446 TaxID=3097355 RepID=UPI002A0F81AD|nr:lysophospholipid acyltransferase family protein [Cognatiyoonia sp. IB215446]MDX8348643.1 lysophospholipid acyltransferase family protein [Cognatiyoonia sp. IB215446]